MSTLGCLGAALQDSPGTRASGTGEHTVSGTEVHTACQGLISALGVVFMVSVGQMLLETWCLEQKISHPISGSFGGFNLINFKRLRAYW